MRPLMGSRTPSIRRMASRTKFLSVALETNGSDREARRLHSMTLTRVCWTSS